MAARVRTRVDPNVRRQADSRRGDPPSSGKLGYHGLTVQELAKRCGLTNGGLLHYFGSKELLLVAILVERDRREAEIISADLQFERETVGETEYSRPRPADVPRHHGAVRRQPELNRLLKRSSDRSAAAGAPGLTTTS